MWHRYNVISKVQNVECRGADHQVGDSLLHKPATWDHRYPGSSPTTFGKGLSIRRFGLQNLSATDDLASGIGFRWHNNIWKAGQWDDSETLAFTDDTVDAQDIGAGDFLLFSATGEAANDGWVIGATRPFNWVSVNVSQATTGNTTFAVRYTNAAGTGWTNATAGQAYKTDFIVSASVVPAGELLWVWNPPTNWGKVTSLKNLPADYYFIHMYIDGATVTQDGLATAMECGWMLSVENLDAGGTFGMEQCNLWDYDADGLVAFISSVGSSETLGIYAEVESVG
jgi:hypothetical protein